MLDKRACVGKSPVCLAFGRSTHPFDFLFHRIEGDIAFAYALSGRNGLIAQQSIPGLSGN